MAAADLVLAFGGKKNKPAEEEKDEGGSAAKEGKRAAAVAIKRAIKDGSDDELVSALESFVELCEGDEAEG